MYLFIVFISMYADGKNSYFVFVHDCIDYRYFKYILSFFYMVNTHISLIPTRFFVFYIYYYLSFFNNISNMHHHCHQLISIVGYLNENYFVII